MPLTNWGFRSDWLYLFGLVVIALPQVGFSSLVAVVARELLVEGAGALNPPSSSSSSSSSVSLGTRPGIPSSSLCPLRRLRLSSASRRRVRLRFLLDELFTILPSLPAVASAVDPLR